MTMSGNHYVYALFRPDNGLIFWIGMSEDRGRIRMHRHRWRSEFGDDIPFVILREGLSATEAADLETALIYAIGRQPDGPLRNVHKGGTGYGRKSHVIHDFDAEARRRDRMSDPDVVAKLRAAKLGKPSAKRGRKFPSDAAKAAQQGFGWISDGITARRVKLEGLVIPDGWHRGRI
jgi:hypothetical protein